MRTAQPWRTNRSRALRSRQTAAELKLWSALRNRQLGGHKFCRQPPIGPVYADFACRELKVIVEIDGATHATADERTADAARKTALAHDGWRVFRVTNHDVLTNLPGVLDGLLGFVNDVSQ